MYTNVEDLAKNRHDNDYLKYKKRERKPEGALQRWLRVKALRYSLITNTYAFDTTERVLTNIGFLLILVLLIVGIWKLIPLILS